MNLRHLISLSLISFFIQFKINAEELRIAVYDSLIAKGGLGTAIKPLFEKKCGGCTIKFIPAGDGGQLITRLQTEIEKSHIAWGLDQNIWAKAKNYTENFESGWRPRGSAFLQKMIEVDPTAFVPYDYGVFTWMADAEELKRLKLDAPRSLKDLQKKIYRKHFILEDPRTSTPGLGFLILTQQIFTDASSFRDFWRNLRGSWVTLTPGWDEAYGLFLKYQAPLVWSYTTSQAYHRKHDEKGSRYYALKISEGHPLQIEGAALVKDAFINQPKIKKLAQSFLEFLISDDVQKLIPETNWMFPARRDIRLPKSFEGLDATSSRYFSPKLSAQEVDDLIKRWHSIVAAP